MLRVFLVIDDYNELIYLQTLLKKLGFDVEGLQNQKKYTDLSLGFNPHLLITTAKGKKVDGLALARSVHKRRGLPKIVALVSGDETVPPHEAEACGIDQVLESPINPKKLILALSTLGNLDETALMDKYSKIKGLVHPEANELRTGLETDENGQVVDDIRRVKSAIGAITSQPLDLASERFEPATSAHSGDSGAEESLSEAADAIAASSPLLQETPERQERFANWRDEMGVLPKRSFDRDRIREFNKRIRSAPPPPDLEAIEDERRRFVKTLFKKGKPSR